MPKTEYHLKVIVYPDYGTNHTVSSIIENKAQLTR